VGGRIHFVDTNNPGEFIEEIFCSLSHQAPADSDRNLGLLTTSSLISASIVYPKALGGKSRLCFEDKHVISERQSIFFEDFPLQDKIRGITEGTIVQCLPIARTSLWNWFCLVLRRENCETYRRIGVVQIQPHKTASGVDKTMLFHGLEQREDLVVVIGDPTSL
jgi:hypothetical protein